MELNKYSKAVTQDPTQPAAQAMCMRLVLPMKTSKTIIGIASTGYEGNPCNMHLNTLSLDIKKGIESSNLVGLIFNTIGVSDGISMGTPGMRFSLPSRDVIADSVETVVQAMSYDGVVTVVGCDKNMPGALMAMLRLNRPSILVYGGTIAPGCHKDKKLDVVSAFEAWGEKVAAPSMKMNTNKWCKMLAQEQALVVECIPPIPWILLLKLWVRHFLTILLTLRLVPIKKKNALA